MTAVAQDFQSRHGGILATFQLPVPEHRAGKPGEPADRNVCATVCAARPKNRFTFAADPGISGGRFSLNVQYD
jgi:hypothetical protein